MNLFIKKTIYFLAVLFAVIFAIPIYVLSVSGELTSIDEVVAAQNNRDSLFLYGAAYYDHTQSYKLKSIKVRKPRIITIGSSRVLQFRSKFFKDPSVFFNAGRTIYKIRHIIYFLQKMPEDAKPDIIILGLDQWLFNEKYIDERMKKNYEVVNDSNYIDHFHNTVNSFTVIKDNYRSVYKDILDNKIQINQLRKEENNVGLMAKFVGDGYRNDGSYYYKERIEMGAVLSPAFKDYEFKLTSSYIEQGAGQFVHNTVIYKKAIQDLEDLFNYCRKKDIKVLGFLPPIPHQVYQTMLSKEQAYEYLDSLPYVIGKVHENYGHCFHNFSDFQYFGAEDSEALDGYHGSEKTYLRLFIKMAESCDYLKEHVDINYLNKKLDECNNYFEVFYHEL